MPTTGTTPPSSSCAVIDENADDAWTAVTHAIYARPEPWQARSTLDTLLRLRHTRERAGDPFPEWLHEIEAELARVADPAPTS